MSRIFIGDLDRAEVLAALFNAQPARYSANMSEEDLTLEEAQDVLENGSDWRRRHPESDVTTDYVDYVRGRPIKINFSTPLIDVAFYDGDAKDRGLARQVIESLRKSKEQDGAE